jgi:CubicO group peptidase (beta-lactamase class C family)
LNRLCISILIALVATVTVGTKRGSSQGLERMGPFLDSLMTQHAVPGIAFAVFDDNGLLYERVSGFKSGATKEPVGAATVFEAASISKPVFAYVVLSLARGGVLELDAPLGTLVPEIPELAHDPRSRSLTPRMLLSHRGGLPNWRSRMDFTAQTYAEMFPPGDTLSFKTDPGTEYGYSGEGYVLLQRIVEKVAGENLNDLARARVFEPLGMTRSSFRFDGDMRRDHAQGHNREGAPDKWPYAQLATQAMVTDTVGGMERRWGPGLGVVSDGQSRYAYHGGNNVIFIADLIYGIEENLGYVLLTNSAHGQRVVQALERRVFGRDLPR